MSTTATAPLAGTWTLDPAHSTAAFAVKYMGVTTFRSKFTDLTATLEGAEDGTSVLTGTVQVESVDIDVADFKGHLMADDFFAVATHPELTFTSSSFSTAGEEITIEGDLTIKGSTQRVVGTGSLSGPVEDFMGNTRVGITVTSKIDRTAFGLDWNAPLPKGGFALANEVKLELELFFVKAA
ncbi:MAG: YceI family protein [Solirubrobacterales bacterium]|jgi:polyisoprenoid-binding protein YceI|nr:YceI family protein [Solirubrobacterales bacterium]